MNEFHAFNKKKSNEDYEKRLERIERVEDENYRISNFKALEKFSNRINVEEDYMPWTDKNRIRDKSDRAVIEQVLDLRTRIILLKMINRSQIYRVNGCISTGKEANVYHAESESGIHYAIKIYKSTILTFKARDKYVAGEFRFRHGYCKKNPRKMVQMWAEKEMRNLKRLLVAGISCPDPIYLKSHVMLMTFIGDQKSGLAAPRLKDAIIETREEAYRLYIQSILILRKLFQECKLVHGDFSEYNILYDGEKLYIIDVSQSVESHNPQALDFLRKDCTNILEYFRRKSISTMNLRSLFDFIVDPEIENPDLYLEERKETFDSNNESDLEEELNQRENYKNNENDKESVSGQKDFNRKELMERERERRIENIKKRILDEQEEAVFRSSYIPQTLDQIYDLERDVDRVQRGESVIYSKIIDINLLAKKKSDIENIKRLDSRNLIEKNLNGIDIDIDHSCSLSSLSLSSSCNDSDNNDNLNCNDKDDIDTSNDDNNDSNSDLDSNSSIESENNENDPMSSTRENIDSRAARKANKKKVKEINRERRKTKMPKKLKKKMQNRKK